MFNQTSEFEAAFGVQPPVTPERTPTGEPEGVASTRQSIAGAIVRSAQRLIATFSEWRLRRQTARALSALDDKMLKDLGLTRSDLGAYGGADDIRWRTIHRWR